MSPLGRGDVLQSVLNVAKPTARVPALVTARSGEVRMRRRPAAVTLQASLVTRSARSGCGLDQQSVWGLQMAEVEIERCLPFRRLDEPVAGSGGGVPANVRDMGGLALDLSGLSESALAALWSKIAELQVPLVGICTAPYPPHTPNTPDGPDERTPPDEPDRRDD